MLKQKQVTRGWPMPSGTLESTLHVILNESPCTLSSESTLHEGSYVSEMVFCVQQCF